MKVRDLIVELVEMNQELDIILQKDPEGNGYSPISGADIDCIYDDGEMWPTYWTANDACMDEEEWQEILKKDRCCVLYPKY